MKESVLWPILQQAREYATSNIDGGINFDVDKFHNKFAELIVEECADIVEQAKKSPFVSLDDAKRMSHFVDVIKKKIKQHFGVEK